MDLFWDICGGDEDVLSLLHQNNIFEASDFTEVNQKELADYVGCSKTAANIKKKLADQQIYLRDSDAAKQQLVFSGQRKTRPQRA